MQSVYHTNLACVAQLSNLEQSVSTRLIDTRINPVFAVKSPNQSEWQLIVEERKVRVKGEVSPCWSCTSGSKQISGREVRDLTINDWWSHASFCFFTYPRSYVFFLVHFQFLFWIGRFGAPNTEHPQKKKRDKGAYDKCLGFCGRPAPWRLTLSVAASKR